MPSNLTVSILLAIEEAVAIPLIIILPILFLAIGIGGGIFFYSKNEKAKKTAAKIEVARILEEANLEAKTMRKEALLEAKEEQHKLRIEFEKETKQRKSEIQKTESRLVEKELYLDKKENSLDKKIDQVELDKKLIEKREAEIRSIEVELQNSHTKMLEELEKVAKMSCDEAKSILKEQLLGEAKNDAAKEAKEIEQLAKENAEKIARNIVGLAIQKCAADHASEATVSVVALPSDDMKGRIIGRVGRNIRALESATGVDIIIDDTPDVVTLSAFDPIRREIARVTLEKLIADGRIHPARIEEMVEKSKKELAVAIKDAGESAVYDVNIFGIHPELVKILGRLKYRTSYGQNCLNHSIEVAYLAGLMAQELGADVKIAKRAGLLHDIGKAVDHEVEGTHIQIGVNLAKKYKESNEVIHALAAHHNDIEPQTIEAILVQAADAISSARPGARRESIENYVKRLESLENIANSFAGVEQSYAIQAGREIRVIVKPEEVNDATTVFLSKEIAKKLETEMDYPGQIKVNVIRELRSVEYAK